MYAIDSSCYHIREPGTSLAHYNALIAETAHLPQYGQSKRWPLNRAVFGRETMIFEAEALDLYERARQRGWWYRAAALLRGRSTNLLDLASITASSSVSARRSLGAQAVPIEQIRGSEGRRADFDNAFHPIRKHTRSRWMGIAVAWLQNANLPPVDLIRLGDIYFVRDGHHRISVVRAFGLHEIDAIVTVWEVVRSQEPEKSSVARPRRALAWRGMCVALPPMRFGDRGRAPSEMSSMPCDASGTTRG
jgi:hypothetical protein